ncbi:cupredoxin domain-containing protein [Tomitella gaofuii]|uniref:cupredoxin domain-containing protein n=1 Tax=Tomitella gaofuii TaxID=2760083 RepID=UPI0015FACFC1|nr:cupredoxin domain-containing protein [Tomitella gaofuii]
MTSAQAGGAGSASVSSTTITIADFAYGTPVTVVPGGTVTVINNDDVPHTVTSDGPGVFDVNIGPGDTVTFAAPTESGSYDFHCSYHPNMHGSLVVQGQ